MFRYFQTSTLILLWTLVLSCLYAWWRYHQIARRVDHGRKASTQGGLILPALALAPVLLVVAHRAFNINLLFPVHFFASFHELVLKAFVPAVVLVVASGLGGQIRVLMAAEYEYWRAKAFARAALAYGLTPQRVLRRLVIIKVMTRAWSRCLPWLFGELMIVEAVFNAPGLGLDAWNLARTRQLDELAVSLGWLAGLYGLCLVLTAWLHGWLGRRLESYA